MRDVKNVRSEAKRLAMRERLRRARALSDDAPVGLRLEYEKIRKSRKKLERRKCFQRLASGHVVGCFQHAALLRGEGEILSASRPQARSE